MFNGYQWLEENTRTRKSNPLYVTRSRKVGVWNKVAAMLGEESIALGMAKDAGVGSSVSRAFGQLPEAR
jgi:hypothetical protein